MYKYMDKEFLQKQKQKLEKRRKELEKELKSFAKKDSKIKGNWKTKFPFFGIRTADPAEQTDQVEEYEATLSVEHTLEIELQKIKKALKILRQAQGKNYGICEKCRKKIRIERLKAYPEAELCMQCTNL